jgi:molecular chaperone GrpE (heat shock protein)
MKVILEEKEYNEYMEYRGLIEEKKLSAVWFSYGSGLSFMGVDEESNRLFAQCAELQASYDRLSAKYNNLLNEKHKEPAQQKKKRFIFW